MHTPSGWTDIFPKGTPAMDRIAAATGRYAGTARGKVLGLIGQAKPELLPKKKEEPKVEEKAAEISKESVKEKPEEKKEGKSEEKKEKK